MSEESLHAAPFRATVYTPDPNLKSLSPRCRGRLNHLNVTAFGTESEAEEGRHPCPPSLPPLTISLVLLLHGHLAHKRGTRPRTLQWSLPAYLQISLKKTQHAIHTRRLADPCDVCPDLHSTLLARSFYL